MSYVELVQVAVLGAQTIVLGYTAYLVRRYTWATEQYTAETSELKRAMVRQNEISLRPVVVPIFEEAPGNHVLKVQNVGAACALNVRVQPVRQVFGEGETFATPHETRFVPLEYLAPGQSAEVQFRESRTTSQRTSDSWKSISSLDVLLPRSRWRSGSMMWRGLGTNTRSALSRAPTYSRVT